jgi:hypothetical protein
MLSDVCICTHTLCSLSSRWSWTVSFVVEIYCYGNNRTLLFECDVGRGTKLNMLLWWITLPLQGVEPRSSIHSACIAVTAWSIPTCSNQCGYSDVSCLCRSDMLKSLTSLLTGQTVLDSYCKAGMSNMRPFASAFAARTNDTVISSFNDQNCSFYNWNWINVRRS